MKSELTKQIHNVGIIAVLTIDQPEHAVSTASALLKGGINAIELTLRTPVALEALRRIKAEIPEMIVGAGTVLTTNQVQEAAANGAQFGLAPGFNRQVVREAQNIGLPFLPGIATPSDIEQALALDCRILKFFPSEPSGGLVYLKSIAAPYAHLDIRYIPLGGINSNNINEYLAEPLILAAGGSWIAPRKLIQNQDWSTITKNALETRKIIKKYRTGEF